MSSGGSTGVANSSGNSTESSGNQSGPQFQSTLERTRRNMSEPGDSGNSNSSSPLSESRVFTSGSQQNMSVMPQDSGELLMSLPEQNFSEASREVNKPVRTLEEARSRIAARLKANNQSNPNGNKADENLAQKDPVTHAFLKELNVSVDPRQSGLTQSESKLAEQNPLTFGLLQYNKVRIETSRTGSPVVTMGGRQVVLNEEQKKLFRSGNVGAFANSLLADVKPDEHTQLLVAASGAARVDYTKQEVDNLMTQGKDKEAMVSLRNNMEGAFSSPEREAVWQIAGARHFNEQYFKAKISERNSGYNGSERMRKVGAYLQEVAENAPKEVSSTALDVIKNDFRPDWLQGRTNARGATYGTSNGQELYQGISALVDRAPERAKEIATWLTDKNSSGNALFRKLEQNGFDAIVEAAKDGHGVALATEINDILKKEADANPVEKGFIWDSDSAEKNRYEAFNEKLEEAKTEHMNRFYAAYVSKQYADFNQNPIGNAQPFFDNMQGDPKIGNPVTYRNDIEMRNIIGKSMGYTPDNEAAALGNDYTKDWYASGSEQRQNIDLVLGWVKREGGSSFSVNSKPFVYASEKAGVSNGALFEVTKANGDKVVIDGSVADDVLRSNKGNPVSANDDTNGISFKYDSVEEFFDDNMLDPEGQIYMAQHNGLADRDGDGHVDIKARAAADTTLWEKASPWVDTAVGVVGVVGGVVLAIPTAGTSLGISAGAATLLVGGSMAYGLLRSTQELHHMSSHGQEIMTLSDQRARGAWLGIAGTVLAGGAIGAGMRGTVQMGRATTILTNAAGSADEVAQSLQLAGSANAWMRAGAVSGYGGALIGVEQTGEQGYMLATQWENMSGQDRALTFLNLSLGVADVGVGVYAHRLQKINAREVQTNKTNSQDEVYNQVAMEIIANGDEIPEIFGRVEDGEGDIKVFFPSNGGEPRPVTVLQPESGRDTGRIRKISVPPEAPGDTTHEDQVNIPRDSENDPAHEFEAFDYMPEDERRRLIGPIRLADDFLGELVVPLRRGIQVPFLDRYMRLRQSVVADYEDATPAQRDSGTFDPRELPKYGEFKADNNTVLAARTPGGLSRVKHDMHNHQTSYARQNEDPVYATSKFITLDGTEKIIPVGSSKEFVLMLAVSGENTRLLMGSIPQFCGGDFHYSSSAPHNMTLRNAQLLDTRVVSDFTQLLARGNSPVYDRKGNYLGIGVELAAKADLSITGFDFSAQGKQDVVAYNRQHMLDNPGMYIFSGEVTGKKENVTPLLGPFGWDMNSPKFQAHLRNSAETGQGVLLHYDWGLHGIKETGGKTGTDPSTGTKRLEAAKTAYENFDEITSVLSRPEYRDVNLVMAHTGLGRYVRPDDARVTRQVTVRDLKGNVIETKELTASEHIHKLYEFFDKVPNARADISWSDVIQAYSDSPQLRQDIVRFIVDNQDRLIFGTDTVSPNSQWQYEQALHMGNGIMTEIARRDPEALWKLLRKNYENVVDDSRARVIEWTARELENQGRHDEVTQMYKMHATLDYYRQKMSTRARREYEHWVNTVREIDAANGVDRRRNPGVYETLFETLPPAKKQEWYDQVYGEHSHGHDHDHGGHGNDRIGTSGGETQGDKALRRKVVKDGIIRNTVAAGAAAGLGLAGVPSDVVNMGAFASRSAMSMLQVIYQERYRQLFKDVFGREGETADYRITPRKMSMFMDMIAEAQKPLGISDEDMLRVYGAAGQFWANYNMIKNIDVNPESIARGWTEEQRHLTAHQEINRFQITLDRELGLGASSIDTWDARGLPGKITSALAWGTFVINDAATVKWFAENGLDFSTMTSSADTMFHGLFGLGNALATYYQGQTLAAGLNGVSPLNYKPMKKLQAVYNTLFTGASAAWTVTDLLHFANQAGAGSISALDAGTGPVKVALDAVLTYALYKLNKEDYKGLTGGQMGDPRDLYTLKRTIFGVLALRTAMEAGLILWRENEEKEEKKAEEAPAGNN